MSSSQGGIGTTIITITAISASAKRIVGWKSVRIWLAPGVAGGAGGRHDPASSPWLTKRSVAPRR